MNVIVKFENTKEEQRCTFESHLTVAKVIKSLQRDNGSYEIRLLTGGSTRNGLNSGVRMNPHRTLRSYRLKESDVLLYKNEVTNSGIWRSVAGNEKVAVIISIPEPYNLSKAMKVDRDITIKELKTQFLKKIFLFVPPSYYALYARFSNQEQDDLLIDSMSIACLHLPTPMRLSCKTIKRSKNKLFGVNPYQLQLVEDEGVRVPLVLVVLKDLIEINNGFAVEGLFRRSGSESLMKSLRTDLENGADITTKDVHSVATLIKRWFKELPARILVQPNIDLQQITSNPEQKLKIQELIPELYANLLTWLYIICLKVMSNYEQTKMDAKNLCTYTKQAYAYLVSSVY